MPKNRNIALSVVVPCYNEGYNIPFILERFHELLKAREDIELILVNNGSSDDSQDILERSLLSEKHPYLRSVNLKQNQGYGGGIMAGLSEARGDHLAWTHADLQTDPADVLKAFEMIRRVPDAQQALVKGRRVDRNWPDVLFTWGMQMVTGLALGCWLSDINAQPKLFPRGLYEKMAAPPQDFSLDLYILFLAKRDHFRTLTVPVSFRARRHGQAKGGGSWSTKMGLMKRTWRYIFTLRKKLNRGGYA